MTSKPVRILIVEDDVVIHRMIERMLREAKWNYQLGFATDGTEAIETFNSFHPDLVILDVNLPRKSGYEICRYIRIEKRSSAAILALSGDGTNRSGILDAGATEFLSKPFTQKELLEKLTKIYPRLSNP